MTLNILGWTNIILRYVFITKHKHRYEDFHHKTEFHDYLFLITLAEAPTGYYVFVHFCTQLNNILSYICYFK